VRWTVVVPVKAAPAAKSRLRAATRSTHAHAELTAAIRTDTLAAASDAASVGQVLIVSDRQQALLPAGPGDSHLIVQRSPGLNRALAEAAGYAARRWPDDGIALLVGDLPALRAADLDAVLADAAGHRLAFVADADGLGTTLLTATPGLLPRPQFGAGSAARHAQSATALEAAPGLRRDVDTDADLVAAVALGVGPATAAVLGLDPGGGSQAVAG
jgi:2-phospho-L-lactate/phosphoenolpyruvate guanylyltransferase